MTFEESLVIASIPLVVILFAVIYIDYDYIKKFGKKVSKK